MCMTTRLFAALLTLLIATPLCFAQGSCNCTDLGSLPAELGILTLRRHGM